MDDLRLSIEAIELELAALQRTLGDRKAGASVRGKRTMGRYEALLRRQARSGVEKLELQVEPASVRARVDGGAWFGLPASSAMLLQVIAGDPVRATDGFPRSRTHAEIVRLLPAETGPPKTPAARVSQLVYRLRNVLMVNDLNPFWVETAGSRGARFLHRELRIEYLGGAKPPIEARTPPPIRHKPEAPGPPIE